jgi:hypothetical protein
MESVTNGILKFEMTWKACPIAAKLQSLHMQDSGGLVSFAARLHTPTQYRTPRCIVPIATLGHGLKENVITLSSAGLLRLVLVLIGSADYRSVHSSSSRRTFCDLRGEYISFSEYRKIFLQH